MDSDTLDARFPREDHLNAWTESVDRAYGVNLVLFTATLGVKSPNVDTVDAAIMRQGGIRLIDGERRTVDLNEGEHADGERSCVVFTYAPGDEENRHRALPEPFFVASLCSSVEQAVRKLVPEFGILRFAILGHSKLQAGLTVQTTLDAVFESGQ